jgi:hypothetical protein
MTDPDVSIVIAVFNEAGNVRMMFAPSLCRARIEEIEG